jgi:hypothetical protein
MVTGYIEYQRREFCKDIQCPVQLNLDSQTPGLEEYELTRKMCRESCIHTTYEFHHWLIQKGYLILRKPD